MENASKALLIAGAILLAILIISLGIAIFGQGQGIVENSGMTKAEIQAYNSAITKYEGDNVSGSKVRELINEINATNAEPTYYDRQIQIECSKPDEGIKTTKTYKVVTSTSEKTGRVNKVEITANT